MWKVVFSSECAQEEKEEQEFGGPVEISAVKEKNPSAVQKGKPSIVLGDQFLTTCLFFI